MAVLLLLVALALTGVLMALVIASRRTRDDVDAALRSFADFRNALAPAVEVLRVETQTTHRTLQHLRHGPRPGRR